MKRILLNSISAFGLVLLTIIYLTYAERFIDRKYLLIANVIIMPASVGIIAYFLFGKALIKITPWILLIPISHVLFFSEDAAKPGVGNIFAMFEFLFILIGAITCALIVNLIHRVYQKSHSSQQGPGMSQKGNARDQSI